MIGEVIGLRHNWRDPTYDSEGKDEDMVAIDSDEVLSNGDASSGETETTSFAARKNRTTRETLAVDSVTKGSFTGIMLRPGSDADLMKGNGAKASFEEELRWRGRYSSRIPVEVVNAKERARVFSISEAETDKGCLGISTGGDAALC